jgi:hypothetical protein
VRVVRVELNALEAWEPTPAVEVAQKEGLTKQQKH